MNSDLPFNPVEADLLQSVRLEASAGTGKTYNLERVVGELIARYEIPLNRILIVTFTNKAARELRERIRRILSELSRPDSGRSEQEIRLLNEARHNYDQAAIYTIHGFCQHVLQSYPFESGSSFHQEFLSDSSLVEEGVRDFLYSRFRRIKAEDMDLIRGFLKKTSIKEAIARLVRVTVEEMDSEDLILIPPEGQMQQVLKEVRDFKNQKGDVFDAVSALRECCWNSDDILAIFKTLKTRQQSSTAVKIANVGKELSAAPSLPDWMDWFFSKQDDVGGIPSELLLNLSEHILEEKCGKGCSLDELPDKTLILCVSRLFEALEPFCDGENSSRGVHRQLLGYAFMREAVSGALPIIRDKKKIRGMRDFSDLIRVLHENLTSDADGPLALTLRQKYRVALVDEFQDTDRMQWDIFRILFDREDHNYFLIGDPKQSIYGFRGADLSVYFEACETVKTEHRYSLGTNYRSRKELVESCNYLFERLFSLPARGNRPVPFQPVVAAGKKGAVPRDGGDQLLPALTICEIHTGNDKDIENKENLKNAWMKDIALRMDALLSGTASLESMGEKRSIQAGDMAVLMDTNRDCETMQLRLEERGISSVIYSDRRVLDSPEADLFGLFLRCLAHPADQSILASLLISPVFHLPVRDVKTLEQTDHLDQIRILFHNWRDTTDRGGLIRVFHILFEQESLLPGVELKDSWKNRLLRQRNGDRSCTNLLHLAELFHREQKNRTLDARGIFDHFIKMKNDPSPDDQRQVRLDKDGEAVQILTHHSSKGLEFPIVFFCGGMQDGSVGQRTDLTYYWEDKRYRDYLLTSDSRKKAALSDWEERKRLYYVSLTRASSLLYLPFFLQGDFCYLTNIYGALCKEELVQGEEDSLLKDLPLCEQWPLHSEVKWKKSGGIKKKKAALNERMSGLLVDLGQSHPSLFQYSPAERPDDANLLLFPETSGLSTVDTGELLHAAEWQTDAPFYKRIISVGSFSSLSAGAHGYTEDILLDDADRDDVDDGGDIPPEDLSGPLGLSRGAEFGNLVHHIFETIDFSWADLSPEQWFENSPFGLSEQEVFLEAASLRFFDQNWWLESRRALGEMIWNVLNCPLVHTGVMKNLKEEDRKHELEFLFRINESSRIKMKEWTVPVAKGYLKGYIDLIFRWEGKLYIADWKTTVPAGRGILSDYDTEKLSQTMHTHLYDVQAMIYVQALRRYMLSLDPDFSYEKDFGGVYYLFVRGMGEDGSRGVHFTRPQEEELEQFLKGSIDYA